MLDEADIDKATQLAEYARDVLGGSLVWEVWPKLEVRVFDVFNEWALTIRMTEDWKIVEMSVHDRYLKGSAKFANFMKHFPVEVSI